MVAFLKALCSGSMVDLREKQFIPKTDELTREIQVYLSFLGAACFSQSAPSFLGRLANDPESIKEIYVPFLANVKEDFYYHISLANGQTFKRYRCKTCKTIFVISDCGEISNHRAREKGLNVGGSKCSTCGKPIGFGGEANTEQLETKKFSSKNFSTSNESQQSYVSIDIGCINEIKIRKLKKRTLLVGHLFTHALLYIGFLFTTEAK